MTSVWGAGKLSEHQEQQAWTLRCLITGVAVGVLACAGFARADDDDAVALLRGLPADAAVAVVVKNVHKLDGAIARVVRRAGLAVDEAGLRAGVRSEMPLGGWLDDSRPMAFAVRADAADEGVIVWGYVANLAARIAQIEGATNSNGVWCLDDGHGGKSCLKTLGGYVVAATSRAALERITDGGVSLVDVGRGTGKLLRAGDAVVHFNMEAQRDRALAFVEEMATLGPLTGMLIGQRLEGGGAEAEALLAALLDGAGELVRQSRFVDVGLRVGAEAVDVTCVISFRKGAVRRYLDKQKPAAQPPFPVRSERPCFLALHYDSPSGEPGGGVYVLDKMIQYLADKRAGRVEQMRRGTAAEHRVTTPLFTTLRVLSRPVRRMNLRMAMGSNGLVVSGDCSTLSARALVEGIGTPRGLSHPHAASTENPKDESTGRRRSSPAGFESIPIEWGRGVPALTRLMAGDTHLALAEVGDRTRFCFAASDAVNTFFRQPAGRSPSPRVAAALAALPEDVNVVLLVDAAGALAVLRRLWGAPVGDMTTSGPLIALSVSLNAGQVALHLHVPLGAIERLQDLLGRTDHS